MDTRAVTQYSQKLNVWAGIVRSKTLGHDVYDGNLTGHRYLHFLQEYLVPTIGALFPNVNKCVIPDENLCYQQDNAPPHHVLAVRRYLDDVFTNK